MSSDSYGFCTTDVQHFSNVDLLIVKLIAIEKRKNNNKLGKIKIINWDAILYGSVVSTFKWCWYQSCENVSVSIKTRYSTYYLYHWTFIFSGKNVEKINRRIQLAQLGFGYHKARMYTFWAKERENKTANILTRHEKCLFTQLFRHFHLFSSHVNHRRYRQCIVKLKFWCWKYYFNQIGNFSHQLNLIIDVECALKI